MSDEQAPKTAGQGPGRPTSYCEEVVKNIEANITVGLSLSDAAAVSGLDKSTVCRWHQLGKAGNPRYSDFFNRVEAARLKMKQQLLVRMSEMALGGGNVRDCMLILERRFPEEWAARDKLDVTHNGAVATGPAILEGLTDEQRKAVRDKYFDRIMAESTGHPADQVPDGDDFGVAEVLGDD